MSRADDVVRARLAAEEAATARAEAEHVEASIARLARSIEAAVPNILRGLEARDYPDAQLLSVRITTKALFRARIKSEQMAAWTVYHDRDSDGSRTYYLLSDGRIVTSSGMSGGGQGGPYTMREILTGWGEPHRLLGMLQRLWDGGPLADGLRGMLARYGNPS